MIIKQITGFITACLLITPSLAQDQPNKDFPNQILKIEDKAHGEKQLQVPIASYSHPNGNTVHLVGAVHIGDDSYYHYLNDLFDTYDLLFYELITNQAYLDALQEKIKIKKGQIKDTDDIKAILKDEANNRETGAIFMLSDIGDRIKDIINNLNISYQTDIVDYAKEHFVHADMMNDELIKRYSNAGADKKLAEILPMLKTNLQVAQDQTIGQMGMLLALMLEDYESVKKLFIEMLCETTTPDGNEDQSILIRERNDVCMDIFDKTMKDSSVKNVGIFYGCAHLPDFHRQLLQRGYKLDKVNWVKAMSSSLKKQKDEINK